NAITTGNPFRPTQGMEIESFMPSPPPPTPTIGGNRVGYPSLWKGGSFRQVQGGGLRLQNFPQTAPAEWSYIYTAYGTVLLALARPLAAAVAMIAILVALAAWGGGIALPPVLVSDAQYLSKGTLAALTVILPAALGLGAVATALSPAQRVTPMLAPALAVIL